MLRGQIWYFFTNIYCIFLALSAVHSLSLTSDWRRKKPIAYSTFLWCVWIWLSWSCSLWKSIFLHLSAYRFRNRRAQMVVHLCDLKYIIDQGPFQKRAYLFSIKGLCISPNTYTDPEIQALTRLSRERGVLKGCFTSRSVGWIQCENSKLVKSTWSSIQRFYFLYFRVKWEKKGWTWFDSLRNEK